MFRAVYRCELVPEDFLFFVSNEFNTSTHMLPVIHNYALTYALARQFYIGSLGTTPHYEELETFDNYATPAVALRNPRFVTHTYNSVCTKTNLTQSSYNVPSLGHNRKITPQSTVFQFFMFSSGEKIPQYVRVGKKSCISKIDTVKLEIIDTIEEPTEPVFVDVSFNVLDLSPNDIISSADMLLMFPSPIARSMTVKAPHYILRDGDREFAVPIPRHLRGVEDE